MNLIDIAFRNIKRNIKNYFIYFISMVGSIMIYYTVKSLQYNKQIMNLSSISKKIENSFNLISIVIAVFVFIFIWYSNGFFAGKRKKEIGLYCMMGLKKNQAAQMLFYENLIMGVLALIFGIFFGIIFSKLFSMILVKLMGFDINVSITVSLLPVLSTIEVFLILFAVTSLSVYMMIYRYEIIDLFKAQSKSQIMPKYSSILSIPAFIFMGLGYSKAINYDYSGFKEVLMIVILTVCGTYMFFTFFIVDAAKFLKNKKALFFKGTNIITFSQFIFRIKNNSILLATIAVSSACTITAVGGAAAIYTNSVVSINNKLPFSYVYEIKDEKLDKDIVNVISNHEENMVQDSMKAEIKKVRGKYPNISREDDKTDEYEESTETIISVSTLKEMLKTLNKDTDISLTDNEVIMYFYMMYSEDVMKNPKGMTMYLNMNGSDMPFEIKECVDYPVINKLFSKNNSILNLVVVSDKVYGQLENSVDSSVLRLINIKNPKKSKDTTEDVIKTMRNSGLYNKNSYGDNAVNLSSYYYEYTKNMSEVGMTLFLITFVGIVFIICTGSIIFFKQMSEAEDDRRRYDVLMKIGLNKKEIRKSIADQLRIVFALPLLVGICHSTVGMKILQPILDINVWKPLIGVIILYACIYYVYYILSVKVYCEIIDSNH